MSLAGVKPYARARLNDLGYQEHYDGFNFENIPDTLLDRAYHVEFNTARGISNNQNNQVIEAPFTVRVFFNGGSDPKGGIDIGIGAADSIVASFIAPTNRLTQSEIHNIRFDALSIEPIDVSNDNSIIVRVEFTAHVIFDTSA